MISWLLDPNSLLFPEKEREREDNTQSIFEFYSELFISRSLYELYQ